MGLALHWWGNGHKQRSTRQGDGGMLVLTRKSNQSIMIGDDIEVSVLSLMGEKVRIGIQAPRDIPVFRTEVYLAIQAERAERAATSGTGSGLRAEADSELRKLRRASCPSRRAPGPAAGR